MIKNQNKELRSKCKKKKKAQSYIYKGATAWIDGGRSCPQQPLQRSLTALHQ